MIDHLRQLVRSLRRAPTFTASVLVTFALGIGATTAVYSVVSHVLLQPFPYPEPERLVTVWTSMPEARIDQLAVGHGEYLDYRAESRLLDDAGAYFPRTVVLTGTSEPAKLQAAATTVSLWRVLGVDAAIGRTFVGGEDETGGEAVVVLSHGLWRSRFGGDPAAVGRLAVIDGTPRRVVGVMPASFFFPAPDIDLFIPYVLDPLRRNNHHLSVVARLKAGVEFGQLQPEMDAIVARWSTLYDHFHPMFAVPLDEQLLGAVRLPLFLLAAAAVLVLLIAAANVAGLLLARGEARGREIAVRAAIGLGSARLVRHLVGEAVALAVVGGALGLVVAKAALVGILAVAPPSVPRIGEVTLDWRVLSFSFIASLAAGLLAGIVPAWRASRPDLARILRGSGERVAAASGRQRLRSVLVVAETALAVVLVAGAAVVARSFQELRRVDPGLEPSNVLTAQLTLPAASYPTAAEVLALYEGLVERLLALPGVRSACVVNALPIRDPIRMILVGGPWQPPGAEPLGADVAMVTPGFFPTLGNPVLRGRPFEDADRAGAERVAALNETAARALFGARDPLGQALSISQAEPAAPPFTVVAVVRDIPTFGLGTEVRPQVYLPLAQAVSGIRGVTRSASVAVKTERAPASLASALRGAVWSLDDALPVSNVETMEEVVDGSLNSQRFQALLLGSFSFLALVLAAVGLYGLLAQGVALRRREIGIRLALGARPGRLGAEVVGRSLLLVGVGIACGAVGTLAASRLLAGLVYGVSGTDPRGLLVTVAALLVTATAAALFPARRAAATDPATVLRQE